MENETENLRALLVALATCVKVNYQLTTYTLKELSALHEAISGLDPTLTDVFAQKQKSVEETFSPDIQKSLAQVEDLIRVIEQAHLG